MKKILIKTKKIEIIQLTNETIYIDNVAYDCYKLSVHNLLNDDIKIMYLSLDIKHLFLPDNDNILKTRFDISPNIKSFADFIKIIKSGIDNPHLTPVSESEGLGINHHIAKVQTYGQLAYLLVGLIPAIYYGNYWYKKHKINKAQSLADKADIELNAIIYKNHKADDPIMLKWYQPLISGVRSLIKGNRNFLLICGPPGTGKSYMVKRELYLNHLAPIKDYKVVKGSVTELSSIIQILYDYRNSIIIFDDFDTLIKNPNMIDILKSASDSYKKRVINFPESDESSTEGLKTKSYPPSFIFSGKIIIITNQPIEEIDYALMSRAMGAINVDFEAKHAADLIRDMLPYFNQELSLEFKQEVYDYLISICHKYNLTPSMRLFKILLDIRQSVTDSSWKTIADVNIKNMAKFSKK